MESFLEGTGIGTGILVLARHSTSPFFVMGFFERGGGSRIICRGWLRTKILLMSAS
jgi:hypothetical protein